MALNLDKSAIEKQYFYEEKGNTYGPFSLSVLLSKIKANTRVYREGIDWTEAKEIAELKNYFKVEKIIEKQNPQKQANITKPIVEQKKGNNGGIWFFIILLVLAGVGYYFYNQNTAIVPEITASIDSVKLEAKTLTDFEIFDFEVVRNYKPTDEQKNIAPNLLNEANAAMLNQNFTEAISKYKESLKNAPQAQTYFLLSNAYLKSNDFTRSEQCLQLATSMDYQPKSELDYKLISIHAIQGNYELVKSELLNELNFNPTILNNVEKDTTFYSFRNSLNYLQIIEKNAIFDSVIEESIYLSIIMNYFDAMNNKTMDANNFYGENVNQFINRKNTNPIEINEIINSNSDFVDSKVNLIGSRVIISGVNSRQAWINFSCYRTSKKKFQSCRVKVEFIFDDQNKIISYKELEIKDLKITKQ